MADNKPERGTPLISLRGVVKTYGTGATAFQALKGIDLDIMAGDFVAVMPSPDKVQMYFLHDWHEEEDGCHCVLVRDDEGL